MKPKCMCNKCNKPPGCNCQKKCTINDVYMFLGKYTFELLSELELPCGHPGLKESLCLLIEGKPLPCGHPTLDQLLLAALEKDDCCDYCKSGKWCKD